MGSHSFPTDMSGIVPFVLVLFIALVVLAAFAAHRAAKRRREAMLALASELGWRFSPEMDQDHDEEYAHFEIFRQGHSRAAFNTMVGGLEIDERRYSAKAGDFRYRVTTSTGKTTTTTTHRFSYLILHLPFRRTPDLLIRPEGLFDKLAGAFGFDDIDFESEEFSRRFHVKSPDKRFAYDVVHAQMMGFLLREGRPAIDIENRRCCLSDGRKRWSPEEFKARIRFLREFFDLWPEHVTAELEEDHA